MQPDKAEVTNNFNTIETDNKPILAALRELEVGDSITYPAGRNSYISSLCSRFGFEWNRKFATRTNREEHTVTVTRTK